MINWRDPDYLILLNGIVCYGLYEISKASFKKLSQAHKQKQKVRDSKIYTIEEYQRQLQSYKKNNKQVSSQRIFLVKSSHPIQLQRTIYRPIHSNQMYFTEPSLHHIMNKQLVYRYMEGDLLVQWGYVDPWNTFIIKGQDDWKGYQKFHIVTDDFFRLDYKFIEKDYLNTLKQSDDQQSQALFKQWSKNTSFNQRIRQPPGWQKVAYILQTIAQATNLTFLNSVMNNRQPLIKGVLKGMLVLTVQKIKGTCVLLKINMNDGIPSIQLAGSSKSSIMQYYSSKMLAYKFFTGYFSVVFALSLSSLFYLSHKKIQSFYYWLKNTLLDRGSYLNPKGVSDDKMCFICYSKCRNIINYDCGHFIMCSQCYRQHGQEKCILCSKNVTKVLEVKMENN